MQRATPPRIKVHRIVVVEDNLDHVHSLAMLLKEMGHSVDFAINGYVAYDVVRRFRPHTVICDLGLPGVSGYEVATQIRKDPELQDVRLVAFTAYSDPKYTERALEAGFESVHVKPIDPKVLDQLFGGYTEVSGLR
jgi:two-component system CheB/CheR fusion protein